jgi:hypothetical protein
MFGTWIRTWTLIRTKCIAYVYVNHCHCLDVKSPCVIISVVVRIGFNTDQGIFNSVGMDPDPGSQKMQIRADPESGQIFPSQKVELT